jgi:hypothetical protein
MKYNVIQNTIQTFLGQKPVRELNCPLRTPLHNFYTNPHDQIYG